MNIRRLIAAMPNLQLQHVRGHQDRRVEYHQLNLMAQLNVDADAMANRFQREYGAVRPHATLTEGAGVHLVTPEGSITSNYASAIRYQATHKPLLQHIRERNGWTASIVDRINWTAHSASLRKRLKQRAHYIKLVHGILPTNSHLHRNNPSRRGCPVCNHRNEEWTHILRCPHSSRVTWRGTLLAEVRKACETRSTRPRLKDILVDGIQGWLESDDPECYQLESSINDDEFQRLIQQQNQIGWKQVFLGRFSWEWRDMQDAYYSTRSHANPGKQRQGDSWQVAIIGCLWDQWYLLWESRNKDLHGADARQSSVIERQNTLRTLRDSIH
jgi:hypothetical protein